MKNPLTIVFTIAILGTFLTCSSTKTTQIKVNVESDKVIIKGDVHMTDSSTEINLDTLRIDTLN